jgi:hypothetical protein
MSFFATEEAHAVMLAGGSRLTATAQFGAKKDIHIPYHYNVT